MEEYGITDRDAFLEHSMNFDLDDNGYLKKAEFVEAAKAFTAGEEDAAETDDSEETVEETSEEVVEESTTEDGDETKDCPICPTSVAKTDMTCATCGFTFI